jgi:hypothetical protein
MDFIAYISQIFTEDINFNNGIISEGLESKMPILVKQILTSKRFNQPETVDGRAERITEQQAMELVRKLNTYDPTGDSSIYTQYIVNQFLKNNIQDEDGQRLLNTLAYFDANKNKASWKALGTNNILNYKRWQDLEDIVFKIQQAGGIQSKNERQSEWFQGGQKVLTIDSNSDPRLRQTYDIYKITTPYAAVMYGQGSRWCTTTLSPENNRIGAVLKPMKVGSHEGYPTVAANYLEKGPLFIIYKDGKPFIQFTHNFDQFKNAADDASLKTCSPALDLVLAKLAEAFPETAAGCNKLRRKCFDYVGRPPFADIVSQ